MTKLLPSLCACGLIAAASLTANARFMSPSPAPLERILKYAEKEVASRPKDADAQYMLARVHYLAFATKRNKVPTLPALSKGKDIVEPPPYWMDEWGADDRKTTGTALGIEERFSHAAEAKTAFLEALRLNPKHALAALGLASLLDQVLVDAELPNEKRPAELRDISTGDIWKAYGKAMDLGSDGDSKLTEQPLSGIRPLVSYEAASALLRLAKSRDLSPEEQKQVAMAKSTLKKLEKLPMGAITPIVFSLAPAKRLDDLLAPEVVVDFDLRGYGAKDHWTWVKPELGILAWDPEETGRIESARQLFGSYTFQLFWKNGYQALSALDDNGDGVLTGAELAGISVWFDRNGNGRSDAGEVTPLAKLGVTALAANATTADGIHPTNPHGITFADGRVLQTWDWIASPLRHAPWMQSAVVSTK